MFWGYCIICGLRALLRDGVLVAKDMLLNCSDSQDAMRAIENLRHRSIDLSEVSLQRIGRQPSWHDLTRAMTATHGWRRSESWLKKAVAEEPRPGI
jgi:hypothetical protein